MNEGKMPKWKQLPPIRALPNAVYAHGNDEYYHVGKAVAAILTSPEDYNFLLIEPQNLIPQLEGQGNIDLAYVAGLTDEDAARPLLMITYPDNSVRLIDGYHRASRAIHRGASHLGVWLLTRDQTDLFRLDAATVKAIGFGAPPTPDP